MGVCGWVAQRRSLFVHLSEPEQGKRGEKRQIGPKKKAIHLRQTPLWISTPLSHSGARRDPQVLAGLFHFHSLYSVPWAHKCFSPLFFSPQSTPKRLIVSRMAHFSQGLNLAAFFLIYCPPQSFSVAHCVFTQWLVADRNSNCLVPHNMAPQLLPPTTPNRHTSLLQATVFL